MSVLDGTFAQRLLFVEKQVEVNLHLFAQPMAVRTKTFWVVEREGERGQA